MQKIRKDQLSKYSTVLFFLCFADRASQYIFLNN